MTARWTQMLATLREQFSPESDLGELESYLVSKGLEPQEIGEVLSLYLSDRHWLAALSAQAEGGARPQGGHAIRVQGPHERGRFTAEAWGFLIVLQQAGLVSPFDFEQLIERALFHIDGRIGLPDIRAMAEDAGLDIAALGVDRTSYH